MVATKAAKRSDEPYLDIAEFGRALERGLAKEPTAALLLTDVDGLHALNTDVGREAGDRVIASAVGVLTRAAKKDGWTLGRLGGDEFGLFASGLSVEQGFLRAEQLRREMDEAFAKVTPAGHRCTASIGVAGVPRDGKSGSDLRHKADLALYAAKDQGGDAVALTPGDDMILKSSYYSTAQLARLKRLAERQKKKEAVLLREALDDLLRKHDRT